MKRLILLACLLPLNLVLRAQSSDPESLPPAAETLLSAGLKKLRGPATELRIGVMVGTTHNGQFGPTETRMEKVIKADLLQQLPASKSIRIIDDKVVAKGVETAQGALQRRAGADVAALTAKLLAESGKADILLMVELTPDDQQQTAAREFRAFDMRASPPEVLSRETYLARALSPKGGGLADAEWMGMMRRGTTDMLIKFGAKISRLEPYVPEYRIQVLDLQPDDQKNWLRAIRQTRTEGLVVLPSPMEIGRETANSTPLNIRYNGAWDDLEDALNATALKTLNRGVRTVFNSGSSDIIVTLQETTPPSFLKCTGADGAAPEQKVGLDISPDRKPTVSIIWGSNVDAPRAALMDESQALPPLEMSDEIAANTLGSYFTAAGFEVKDSVASRQKLAEEIKRGNLENNLSGMRDALRRSNAADFLVLVRTEPTTKKLSLTIVNNRGAQVAFAHYPDSKVLLYEKWVNPKDPASLMRYLSGTLLQQVRTYALNSSLRSIEVMVKNTRNAQQVLEVAAAFRQIEGVLSVTDVRIDQPAGRFSVNTTGDVASLVQKAADLIAQRKLGVKGIVEVANEQEMVLNVMPEWTTMYDVEAAEKKAEELQKPDSPKPKEIQEALRAARSSVWMVGLELENGTFIGGGTAWTVRPRSLATNAHVLKGIQEAAASRRQKNIKFQVVARNGDNLEKKIVIDLENSKYHPGYDAFEEKKYSSKFITPYDVAVLMTLSDAGVPLNVATPKEFNALLPLDTIGYTGYPQENRQGDGKSQQTLMGTINTISSVFLRDSTDPLRRKIIHFSMATTGGASGSPILGPNGSVVGINCAGDYVFTQKSSLNDKGQQVVQSQRIPVGFKYAQGIDMLTELLDGKVDVLNLSKGWDAEYEETR